MKVVVASTAFWELNSSTFSVAKAAYSDFRVASTSESLLELLAAWALKQAIKQPICQQEKIISRKQILEKERLQRRQVILIESEKL